MSGGGGTRVDVDALRLLLAAPELGEEEEEAAAAAVAPELAGPELGDDEAGAQEAGEVERGKTAGQPQASSSAMASATPRSPSSRSPPWFTAESSSHGLLALDAGSFQRLYECCGLVAQHGALPAACRTLRTMCAVAASQRRVVDLRERGVGSDPVKCAAALRAAASAGGATVECVSLGGCDRALRACTVLRSLSVVSCPNLPATSLAAMVDERAEHMPALQWVHGSTSLSPHGPQAAEGP